MKTYAGIGTRELPNDFAIMFTKLAIYLSEQSFTLLSGGASGSDMAFEKGAGSNKVIFLPWNNFNGKMVDGKTFRLALPEANKYVVKYHPNASALSQGGFKLMARNSHQVLGVDLKSPVSFVICYTKNASGSGGTGQALRIAKDNNIPIFDCGAYKSADDCFEPLNDFILQHKKV